KSGYDTGDRDSYVTYGYNYMYLTNVTPSGPGGQFTWNDIWQWCQGGVPLAAVNEPAQTLVFADGGHSDGPYATTPDPYSSYGGHTDTWFTLLPPSLRANVTVSEFIDWTTVVDARHTQQANISLTDGHVKSYPLAAVYGRWVGTNFYTTLTPPDQFFCLSCQAP
ncbi:MAG TPA: hypothetical protein VGS41_00250, partial [Chthonomonadales bacterium]|nr:hypothetical protein [Chthonomonadales bacterium]